MNEVKVIILKNNTAAVIKAITGEALKRAAMAGGQVVEAQAKINVEHTFSHKSVGGAGLGGSIQTVPSMSDANSAWMDVGPTVIYGRIQELGGIVKPVHAKMLSWVDDGIRIFAKLVHIPPRPYLRPAIDESEEKIKQAVGYQIKKQIEQVAK